MAYAIEKEYGLYIGGKFVAPQSKARLESISPLTGEVLCTIPDASAADVDAAVRAARGAWPGWFEAGPRKRQSLLMKAADRLAAEAERFAWLETSDTGKPWRESLANVHTAADRIRYYAGACRALEGNTLPVGGTILSLDFREPLGVVGILGAWNFPLNMFAGKIAPALAVGNAVVYKPAEPTPITTLEFARILGEVLPPGVINVVTGNGDTAGAAMVAHPGIRKISITGAVETGKRVMADAGKTVKQLTLELGGKNAQIVCEDADLNRAAQGILLGAFMNQGQVCTSGSRIFAHRKIAKALGDKIVALIPKLKVGDPFAKDTTMGTLCYREHFDRVRDYIEIGKREGATLLAGGGRLAVEQYPDGLFLEPTLFAGVRADMRVAREEIFGPVATLHEWDDEAAMLEEANGLDYGLAAGIWTENFGRAHRLARRVEAGRVWINCYNLFPSGAAFGGTKGSGFGREDSFETMLAFTQVKNVVADIAAEQRRFYE
ncbi:MAG: aldehyde dehydrogenase [Rhodospirillaceae bacterium]|nr:aldehyde dehydrogenase [Rhodospirillaceae bacterium]